MKITIDTDTKTIHVSEELPICQLYKWIKAMFPDDRDDWKVVSETKIQLVHERPITLPEIPYDPWRNVRYIGAPSPYLQPRTDPSPPWEVTCKSDD